MDLLAACARSTQAHGAQYVAHFAARADEDHELYEERVEWGWFCRDEGGPLAGAPCRGGAKSMDELVEEGARRQHHQRFKDRQMGPSRFFFPG